MTTTPNNPIGPEEADLLAWVEGETLSPEMDAAVARLLMSDPRLTRELEGMRRDRDALRSLEEVKAPSGLMESVEAAMQPVLERQLLLGLQDGEPVESHPVVSMVRPERRGIFQTFLADRSGRRMAMAAGLLLVVGGGTYWATTMLSGPTAQPLKLALNTEKSKDVAHSGTGAALVDKPSNPTPVNKVITPEPVQIASAPQKPVDPPTVDASATPADAGKSAETLTVLVGPVKASVDGALAAELAREGRLVIRVVSTQAGRSPASVADHLKKECSGPGWKLASDVPAAIAAAVAPEPVDWTRFASTDLRPEEAIVVAGDADVMNQGLESFIGPPAPTIDPPQIAVEQAQSVYMLQARLDAATMDAVKKSLQRAGRAEEVVFEERYESLPLDQDAPILNPNAMIWWTNAPAGWTKWGEVPVVIDPKR